jgi:hypothetical protein
MKKALFLMILLMMLAESPAWAERWMWCGKEKVWVGDSIAEVQMKCGRPNKILVSDSVLITEQIGNKTITKILRRNCYLYPGDNAKMYYLQFVNNELIAIDQSYLGTIPR